MMMSRYDGIGRTIYDPSERRAVVNDLLNKVEQSNQTAVTYDSIGYQGHAAAARNQADRLGRAVSKVLRGEGVSDYERRAFDG
jgi:type IV secretory pathway protease TraF